MAGRRAVARRDVRALSSALCGPRGTCGSGIPDPRMSQLPTNPILAAPVPHGADRRISAGFIVDAASGPRLPSIAAQHALLTQAQSYQRRALLRRNAIERAQRALIRSFVCSSVELER